MAVRVLELHHHGVRVPFDKVEEANRFYTDVLGLRRDTRRPEIPYVPGLPHFNSSLLCRTASMRRTRSPLV